MRYAHRTHSYHGARGLHSYRRGSALRGPGRMAGTLPAYAHGRNPRSYAFRASGYSDQCHTTPASATSLGEAFLPEVPKNLQPAFPAPQELWDLRLRRYRSGYATRRFAGCRLRAPDGARPEHPAADRI